MLAKASSTSTARSRRHELYDLGVLITEVMVLFRSMVRRLPLIEDVEHAHSPGTDVAISGDRDLLGCGHCLDALGDGAEDVQAVSEGRSHRVG